MQIVIDISKDRYDEIMSMDWNNCRRFFDEELRAIHDGKALEQEPCDDCISRQQAIDAIDALYLAGDSSASFRADAEGDTLIGKYQAITALDDLQPVTPQPKMGLWIMSDDGLYRPICNNCGAHPWKGYIPTVEEATEVFKYCPTCGSYNGGEG